MGKIAYLVGESGIGKTSIARQLPDQFTLLAGDLLAVRAAAELFESHLVGQWWNFRLWRELLQSRPAEASRVFGSAIREAIEARGPNAPARDAPVLAEAVLFALVPFREAFRAGLELAGCVPGEAMIFWLDATAEEIVDRSAERARRWSASGMPPAVPSIAEAQKRLDHFHRQLLVDNDPSGLVIVRSRDSDKLAREICRFLDPNGATPEPGRRDQRPL